MISLLLIIMLIILNKANLYFKMSLVKNKLSLEIIYLIIINLDYWPRERNSKKASVFSTAN